VFGFGGFLAIFEVGGKRFLSGSESFANGFADFADDSAGHFEEAGGEEEWEEADGEAYYGHKGVLGVLGDDPAGEFTAAEEEGEHWEKD